eukprot:TRINITY_DN17234_c0_g1_i1.p1 TRINITY_DN17234_c0_g1~~TRINITY_DN17234_c0_g1_i1.p1  ORF type:complete len:406 (+),score=134.24 TRINITY_DN17234_c0_g1_i1:81-1298(+)
MTLAISLAQLAALKDQYQALEELPGLQDFGDRCASHLDVDQSSNEQDTTVPTQTESTGSISHEAPALDSSEVSSSISVSEEEADTVIIESLPVRCPINEVIEAVFDMGFTNDMLIFASMPMRRGFRADANRGYCFIRFQTPALSKEFQMRSSEFVLKKRRSKKVIKVEAARYQGLELASLTLGDVTWFDEAEAAKAELKSMAARYGAGEGSEVRKASASEQPFTNAFESNDNSLEQKVFEQLKCTAFELTASQQRQPEQQYLPQPQQLQQQEKPMQQQWVQEEMELQRLHQVQQMELQKQRCLCQQQMQFHQQQMQLQQQQMQQRRQQIQQQQEELRQLMYLRQIGSAPFNQYDNLDFEPVSNPMQAAAVDALPQDAQMLMPSILAPSSMASSPFGAMSMRQIRL